MPTLRRILRWTTRIVLCALALVALLLLGGAGYQAIAGNVDPSRYPSPGQLIDVGGRRLHLYCTGQGSPTVVFEAGLGLGMVTWRHVQPRVSQITRACSYDRAGYGWSDSGPLPRTSDQITNELHTLLEHGNVHAPLVFVGHSLGGLYARHYAAIYPSDVSGVVLVDSSHEDQGSPGGVMQLVVRGANAVGVGRLLFRFGDEGLNAVYTSNKTNLAVNEEFAAIAKSFDEVRRTRASLGSRPLVVITAGNSDTGDWHVLQLDLLSRSTNSRRIVAQGSGHYVHDEQPDLVIAAIRETVENSRQY